VLLLAKTEAESWHLAPGVVPSPTALYCEALAGLDEKSEEVSAEAMGVLVGVMTHLKDEAEGGEGDEGEEEGGFSAEHVAGLASDLLPTFEGRVLYPTISTIPKARYGWPPNCEVLFVGPGLEATLVATQVSLMCVPLKLALIAHMHAFLLLVCLRAFCSLWPHRIQAPTTSPTQGIASGEGLMFGEDVEEGQEEGEGDVSDEDEGDFGGEEEEMVIAQPPSKRVKRTR
jgi:hypothetical protein